MLVLRRVPKGTAVRRTNLVAVVGVFVRVVVTPGATRYRCVHCLEVNAAMFRMT